MEKYEPLGVVGEGSYGVVLKCRCRENGKIVAIKKFIDSEDDQNVRKIALREIRVLRKLRHENLVNLLEVFRRRKHLYLVFEFIDHTLLDQLEQKSHGLDEEVCRKYIYQILRGLGFCHDNQIIHRDLKPENILVSKSGILKICDFGFARNLCAPGDVYTDYVATRWYRAPELLVGAPYGKEVDIWALGTLFAEMMSGEPLFPGDSDIDQLFLISSCLGRLSKRHLSIMAKNSAFKNFQYPEARESRHGSTASSVSTKFTKISNSSNGKITPDTNNINMNGTNNTNNKFSSSTYSGNGIKKTVSSSHNSTSGGKRRLASVEKSVFGNMFPSWSDDAVHFLNLCLDPEPSARPTCSVLMRLPYFTHDNFPTRFMHEFNTKLQQEGRNPIPSYSTRKKRSVLTNNMSNVNPSNNTTNNRPPLVNVTSTFQFPRNPLHQTRTNLAQDTTQENNSNNFPIQSNLNPTTTVFAATTKFQLSNLQGSQNNLSRQSTFLVKDKFITTSSMGNHRKPSFTTNNDPPAPIIGFQQTNNESVSRIPFFVRKHSDDMILNLPSSKTTSPLQLINGSGSSSGNNLEESRLNFIVPSKSSPNLSETQETNVNYVNATNNKEKRFSISQIPINNLTANTTTSGIQQQQPPSFQLQKKFSFSFPPSNLTPVTPERKTMDSPLIESPMTKSNKEELTTPSYTSKFQGSHLPVTTLTFNLGPHNNSTTSSTNSNISNPNPPFSFMNPLATPSALKSPGFTSLITSNPPNNIKNNKAKSLIGTFLNSNFFQNVNNNSNNNTNPLHHQQQNTQHFSTNNSQNIGHVIHGNHKSLPVSVFGSSMMRHGVMESSFLPRMTTANKLSNLSGGSNLENNEIDASLPALNSTKGQSSTLGRKKEKWTDQTNAQGRKSGTLREGESPTKLLNGTIPSNNISDKPEVVAISSPKSTLPYM